MEGTNCLFEEGLGVQVGGCALFGFVAGAKIGLVVKTKNINCTRGLGVFRFFQRGESSGLMWLNGTAAEVYCYRKWARAGFE